MTSSHPCLHRRHTSDAHLRLLRGLDPLPSHGLPLPAPQLHPQLFALDARQASRSDAFASLLADVAREVAPTVRDPAPTVRDPPARAPSPSRAPVWGPGRVLSPAYVLSPPATQPTPAIEPTPRRGSAPNLFTAPATFAPPPTSTLAPFASTLPAPSLIPPPGVTVFPTQTQTVTPLRRGTPDGGSGSDEVVFRGRSPALPLPQKGKRRKRDRIPMRANSESMTGRQVANESVARTRARSTVRRTAQSLMRRAHTGEDWGEVSSSDGRDVVLFVPRSLVPSLPSSHLPAQQQELAPPAVIVEPSARPMALPSARKESIPFPGATYYAGSSTEPAELPRKHSIEPQKPIIELPPPSRPLAYLPWSPPRRVPSRPEMASREGSFCTAPDTFVEDLAMTDAEFPSSTLGSFLEDEDTRYVPTPVHMDLSELEEESARQSMVTADSDMIAQERATISSAMRGQVSQPVTMARRPSGEFVPVCMAPGPPQSATPARRRGNQGTRNALSGVSQTGFLVPPSPLAPSSLASSGLSQAPHSSCHTGTNNPHTASIPMVHDQSYSPPRFGLPLSVTPRTEASVRLPDSEDESFHSTHTADPTLRLPLDDWLEFATSSMAAIGIPLAGATLNDLHESEDEGVASTKALSTPSVRGPDTNENRPGDNLSPSLSNVEMAPSPSRSELSTFFSAPTHGEMIAFSTESPAPSSSTPPTIWASGLEWEAVNNGRLSMVSTRAVHSVQNIAAIVQDSATSSQPSGPPSIQATSTPQPAYVAPPPFLDPSAAYQTAPPASTLSPGTVSITFGEANPYLPFAPPLVVLPRDRDPPVEHRHSFQHLRDDDYRAPDEADAVPHGAREGYEQTAQPGAESLAETGSAIPTEFEGDGPANRSPPADNKSFLSLVASWRPRGPNKSPRWVKTVFHSLRRPARRKGLHHPSDLGDAVGLAEEGPRPSTTIPEAPAATVTHSRSADKPIQCPAVVTSGMDISEAFCHLIQHGCIDVTPTLAPVPEGRHGPTPLAGGRFGDVYKWTNTSGLSISIKCLRIHALSDTSSKNVKRATRELYYWAKAKHENVLELLGVAEFNGQLAMVSPWMENGTLSQYLLRLSPKTDRWDLCLQVGEGLAYLHEIGMVHGDLKAMNILVSNEGVVKISDFGNSILEDPSLGFTSTKTVGGGSLRWMAFELIDDKVDRTNMTDVHSLGMTILEVVTGRVPYCECHADTQVLCALMKKRLPIRPVELSKDVKWGNEQWELMVKCWNAEPSQRPTSRAVLNRMKELRSGN